MVASGSTTLQSTGLGLQLCARVPHLELMSEIGRRWNRGSPWCSWLVRAIASAACAGQISCSEENSREPVASFDAALIGGSLSPVERDAVVFLRANHPDGVFVDCTGTLLSPHVLITAKHCVTLVKAGEFVCTGAGTLVENGQGAGMFGAKVAGPSIEIFPGTAPIDTVAAHVSSIFTSESSDACHDDIAALVLDTPIPQDHFPSLRASRPTVVGERVRLVGYGTLSRDSLVERRELADVRVNDVGHDDGVPNPNATTPPRTLAVGGGSVCFGDSGGPALSMDTGALVGVYSRITGECLAPESRNTYVLTSSFFELFGRAFAQAGEQPTLEAPLPDAPSEPAGVAGTGGVAAMTTVAEGGVAAGAVGGKAANIAGASALVESVEPSRHEAFRCTLRLLDQSDKSTFVAWLIVALIAGFSRRCRAPRPF